MFGIYYAICIIVAIIILSVAISFVVFFVGKEKGFGVVPNKTEKLLKRLKVNTPYELVYSLEVGSNEHIILVKKLGLSDFRVIRYDRIPPKYFLINREEEIIEIYPQFAK